MTKKIESKERIVQGKKLKCSVCNNDRFWERETLMNTQGMTFFGLDWANKPAQNFICDNCGLVYWFMAR